MDDGVTQTISDRQWGAYEAACKERNVYKQALTQIIATNMHSHQPDLCPACIARIALGVES